MKPGRLGALLCGLALLVGVVTSAVAVQNRARGDELDRLERWCEARSRQNQLRRVAIQRREWELFSGATGVTP